ncbi:MAG TPA: hypothetical protein VN844_28685 [Pyrinomonadaceae bacterium]|nr:hypothetical protein [Pyrinomonadaceae bacterium]
MFFSKTKRNYIAASTLVLMLVTTVFTGGLAQTKKKKRTIKYYTVAANQVMRVRLNDELDSEKARIGDTFTSTLVDPVYSKTGLLLAPQGSIVGGRVTSVQRAQKKGKPAELLVQFTSLELPNGYRRALNGSLTDLESSTGTSDNEGTVTAHKTSKRKAKFIGGGAAGGAVIGAIAGGGKGLAIGAGVGALTGAITGRVKKGHEVKVKSGTEFGVILNAPVSFPEYRAG